MSEKTIDTLVEDVEEILSDPSKISLSEEQVNEVLDLFQRNVRQVIEQKLIGRQHSSMLRMSNYGTPDRKLWYTVNQPDTAEDMPPEAYLKFLYGDMIEELMLLLARLSCHNVEGEQDVQEVEGVIGHRDAVIDGEVVDVKSASSFSFQKFNQHKLPEDDPFHYLDQINLYLEAGQSDDTVMNKDRAHFWAVDKVLGKQCLDTHQRRAVDYAKETKRKKTMLSQPEPPERCHSPVPDGKSGNMKLGTECSYCAFKNHCWPGLRTYAYSSGPRFLTRVVREPDVPKVR